MHAIKAIILLTFLFSLVGCSHNVRQSSTNFEVCRSISSWKTKKNRCANFFKFLGKKSNAKGASKHYHYGGYDFTVKKLSGVGGIRFYPRVGHDKKFRRDRLHEPVVRDLDSIWDKNGFLEGRGPVKLGLVPEPQVFSQQRNIRILDMPIKMAGSNEYRVPAALAPFESVIKQIVEYEHKLLPPEVIEKYHAYITVDQGYVEAGKMQRKPGAHVDGFQGARNSPKNELNHSYIVSNLTPTVFFRNAFDFRHLDDRFHNLFHEMDSQARAEDSEFTNPNTIYLMDALSVHGSTEAKVSGYRTFLRLSYDIKKFDRLGNTHNPLFDYNWDMLPRETQSELVKYESLSSNLLQVIQDAKSGRESNIKRLESTMASLKKMKKEKALNFCYEALQSGSTQVAEKVFVFLRTFPPSDLMVARLLFAVSASPLIGKKARTELNNRLLIAKGQASESLYLDLVLEIMTVDSSIISNKNLKNLLKGYENSHQAKEIRKNKHTSGDVGIK